MRFGTKTEKPVVKDHDDHESHGTPRWIAASVVGFALFSFVGLAWYAYNAGSRSVKEEDLVLIEADSTPVKDRPEDPGGMKFPHQDKTIFDAISATPPVPTAERVLPAPEEPMSADQVQAASQDTKTWVNEKLKAVQSGGAAQLPPVEVATPELKPAVPAMPELAAPVQPVLPGGVVLLGAPAQQMANTVPAAGGEPSPAAPVVQVPAAAAPAPVETLPRQETKPVELTKPTEKAVQATDDAMKKPAPKVVKLKEAAKPKPASGGGMAQLGAYKSEAEAKRAWNTTAKKYSELSDLVPLIEKADLGTKGVFYRLRVHTPNAKELCAQLAAKKQACMPVK